ncbi:Putative membrane protein [Amycolatopsis japonica]|uniref:Putative membrane protein n=1 Tax=Amycolatopsis japonica TaxID=208439 RepID=A0A075V3T3_9PSEU|nr:hypothetical protein [Amycolatopsis japonica]AIG79868.1 Putative membrane protein [Amycolatopsis japonica]
MGAGSELRKILSQRLLPLIAEIEELVYRYGYIRVFGSAVAMLGTAGLLGQVLGIAWLRTTFATAAAFLFVVAALVSFAGGQKQRNKLTNAENILHGYADAMHTESPIVVKEWRQDVIIEDNGDAYCQRTLILDAAANGKPRYVSINLVYYGAGPLTDRARRKVVCKAFHAGAENSAERTRANATSTWKTARNGKPRLDVYVHLGTFVQDGDLVTVEWFWPKYSADLMSGAAPEAFDVVFDKEVSSFTHRVVFRNIRNPSLFTVRNQGARNFKKETQGRDVIVEFSATRPEMNQQMGFIADYTRNG